MIVYLILLIFFYLYILLKTLRYQKYKYLIILKKIIWNTELTNRTGYNATTVTEQWGKMMSPSYFGINTEPIRRNYHKWVTWRRLKPFWASRSEAKPWEWSPSKLLRKKLDREHRDREAAIIENSFKWPQNLLLMDLSTTEVSYGYFWTNITVSCQ